MPDRQAAGGVTRKEAEVLAGLGEQLTNAEIAARMYVSERTVETHVSSLLRKFGAGNRRELGRIAGRAGAPAAPIESPSGPSGTVTFLFTDIEDSTAMWERLPLAMPGILARHDAALREAITRHGGHVFATAGDGFGAAFASAPEAVAAAVDAQRSLVSTAWPDGAVVRVRMGVHTGTATERDGDYVGAAVNRAARISAIGRGGHILLSAASADLVADEGWTMSDLGRHRLKGLERPERIVRLDVPGLPVVTLPLRAGREGAGNMPHPSTRLIGRDDELRQLGDLLGAHRLVTITGPGGAGKTRLAIAAAAEFSGGGWLVELGELQDAADVPAAVATTLSLQPATGTDHVASIVAALADQHALLVFDNCEHVIDGVVALVTELEAHCAGLTVLGTSREVLGLAHEVRVDLRPLGSSDATELFRERAASVRGTFEPSDADLALIDEICQRLDRLPLAIELAVARLSAMSVAELRSHLDDRFELLTRRRGVTARHQSLRATVAWSYDLLTDAEQMFFDQLSVFGGDFGPGAAGAVGGDLAVPGNDLLMSLVDKSLLIATHGPLGTRFRQLETLRQYGEARLDARGGRPASMRRQLDYYVAWTEAADTGIKGPDERDWHLGFTAEWPNLRNVFRWACQVDDGDAACRLVNATLWWATSRMRLETARWCDLALELPSAADHRLRPVLLAGAALFSHMRNDGDGERRSLELAAAEEARLGPAVEPWVPAALLNQWAGGPAAALDDVAVLRRRAATASAFWQVYASLAEALILATLIRGRRPSPDEEDRWITRLRQVVDEADAFGQPSGAAFARASLGTALRRSEPAEALALLEDALDLSAPLSVDETSNTARRELASHYTQLGRPLDALALMRDVLPHHVRTGAWHEVRESLPYIAGALADVGCPRAAATILGRIGADSSDLVRTAHGVAALDEQLRAELGAAEVTTVLDDSRTLTLADVAQIVVDTIDSVIR